MAKKNNIKMYRGNTYITKIIPQNYEGNIDKIYFTARNENDEAKIWKKLNDGITKIENENAYKLTIVPDDTNNLEIGTYKYDIEIHINDFVKTVIVGNLTLLEEQTRKTEEV